LGKIEKSFLPKLPDYFIQGVRNSPLYHLTSAYNITKMSF